jgi:tetratricopeptide (TPR) repeat protein
MAALAIGYMDIGRNQDARELLEPAADRLTAEYGLESRLVIDVRVSLAWALYLLQEYSGAEALNLELLDIQRRVLGPEAYESLVTLNNLGLIYSRMGDFEKAVDAHREELMMSRRAMGADHPEVLVSTLNLARATFNAGQSDVADDLFLEAYETGIRVLPPVHPLRAAVTLAQGVALARNGNSEQARELYLAARDIYEQLFEPDHPVFARLEERLAELDGE